MSGFRHVRLAPVRSDKTRDLEKAVDDSNPVSGIGSLFLRV